MRRVAARGVRESVHLSAPQKIRRPDVSFAMRKFRFENVDLSFGGFLPEVELSVEEWGDSSLRGERTVVILPSFSHGSHVAASLHDPSPGWWEKTVGPGKAVDTNHFRIISPSILGSPFGSTNPSSVDPRSGKKYGVDFPQFSPLDQARLTARILDEMGIERVHGVIGASLGGMQALQFAVEYPERLDRLVAIATTGRTSPGSTALRHIQRSAIMSDPAWNGGVYEGKGPVSGMKVARKIGFLGYRSREEMDARFDWSVVEDGVDEMGAQTFDVEGYLEHQGNKFATSEFDANSYLFLSKAMDLHNIANPHVYEGRTVEDAAKRIRAQSLLIGVQQDILIPPQELSTLAECVNSEDARSRGARGAKCVIIDSHYGHDAFLKEDLIIGPLIRDTLEQGLEEQLRHEKFQTTGLSGP